MNVTETKSQGLLREYRVSVPAAELAAKLTARIDEIRPKMQVKGFRPGKVPTAHIRKMYGRSLMGEILETVVQETSQKAISDNSLRPAAQPTIHLETPADKVVAGEADLEYHMHLEVMPEFEPADVSELSLERLVAQPTEAEIDEALGRIADSNKRYDAREDGAQAQSGDAVTIDFVGRIDGEAFDGGSAEGQTIVLGDGRFIPGFEDQLIGAKSGEQRLVDVAFPEDYPVETLKGKPAQFDVTVREVKAPSAPVMDDEFAKQLGLADMSALREAVKEQLAGELSQTARQIIKRRLLDALDERHAFELPPGMVEAEFGQIWSQYEQERDAGNLSEEEKAKPEEDAKADYRKIAERRVRLGLVLAEIGRRAEVEVPNEELSQALRREAMRYPGQEQQVIAFFRENPAALAQLRAPIYEEKVVDYILARAKVTETPVSREVLTTEAEKDA